MARRASPDPEILLRKYFSREIELERLPPESRVHRGAVGEGMDGRSGRSARPMSVPNRRGPRVPELAAAAVLAACVGAALLAAPEPGGAAVPEVLGERAVSVGISASVKLIRAVSAYADLWRPASDVPGRFRGKD